MTSYPRLAAYALLPMLAACGTSPHEDITPDSGIATGSDAGSGSGSGSDSDAPSFATLDAWLHGQVTSGAIHGYAMQVYDGATDALLFESQSGVCPPSMNGSCPSGSPAFTADLVTGVASSSKWVTSSVVLAALDHLVATHAIASIDAGLNRTVGSVLSCASGRGATVTLRQLLSFTDGLLPDDDCVGDGTSTMQACACKILSDSAAVEVATASAGSAAANAQPPGSVYKYGSAHQVIAAAMIETASGQSFETLYETLVKNPLGLLAQYKNPTLVSGSLHTTVADYSKFVRAVYHDGVGDHATAILSKAAVTAQEASQMPPGVVYRGTPQPGLEYGLNTWRWCYQPLAAATLLALDGTAIQAALDPSCAAVHQQGHGGKGGYQPFIDRARGIYGVFAMREPSPGGDATYTTAETNMTTVARLYAGLVADELHGVAP